MLLQHFRQITPTFEMCVAQSANFMNRIMEPIFCRNLRLEQNMGSDFFKQQLKGNYNKG